MEIDPNRVTALLYGLSIINEKERERGLPLGSIPVDGNALAHFVETKSAMLETRHMNDDTETTSTGTSGRILWTDEEIRHVAAEYNRRFPGEEVLPYRIKEAQMVLRLERRKTFFSPTMLNAIKYAIVGNPIPPRLTGRASRNRQAAPTITLNGHKPEAPPIPSAPAAPVAAPGTAEALAEQIIALIHEVSAKALSIAAERFKS